MIRWKRSWPDLPENLPVDVMPASNGEFIPDPPSAAQREIMRLARDESERWAHKMGMSRRHFLRTAAAFTVGFWAINQVGGTRFGHYALAHGRPGACDQAFDEGGKEFQFNNLPGEFIFDIQSHHVDSGGMWRVTNPGMEAFFAVVWPQSSPIPEYGHSRGEVDPIEYLSQYYYVKELFLESATNVTVLSHAPSSEELNPLPTAKAAETARLINKELARSTRTVMHAFVMPNRGAFNTSGNANGPRLFMEQEFAMMEDAANQYGDVLRAWKVYTPWGDIPNASGWFLDDHVGRAFVEKVIEVGDRFRVPKTICLHKGFALPSFDQRSASPRDIGPIASNEDYYKAGLNLIVYHSGYNGGNFSGESETIGPYPGDSWNSADLGTDSLVKSLREHGWSARHFAPGGQPSVPLAAGDGDPDEHGNVPNVYAEIGGSWRSVFRVAEEAIHFLGKLIYYVGPKRVVWGTDSLWFGSPQSIIVAMRTLQLPENEWGDSIRKMYRLPYWLDGDVEDPTHPAPTPARTIRNAILGRNAAALYGIDVNATLGKIACDDVQAIRDAYLINPLTPDPRQATPLRSNAVPGYRTRRELFRDLASKPWGP